MIGTETSESLEQLDPNDPDFAVRAVDLLLTMASRASASDLHLQPRRDGWEVLIRVDGVLSPIGSLRGGGSSDPVTRLMVLAGLPTYRDGKPMEGRLKWEGNDLPSFV